MKLFQKKGRCRRDRSLSAGGSRGDYLPQRPAQAEPIAGAVPRRHQRGKRSGARVPCVANVLLMCC